MTGRFKIILGVATGAGLIFAAPSFAADDAPADGGTVQRQQPQLNPPDSFYRQKIEVQRKLIEQRAKLVKQLQDLANEQDERINKLEQAVTQQPASVTPAVTTTQTEALPPPAPADTQVGQTQPVQGGQPTQPPAEGARQPKLASLPEIGGVLVPENKLTLEPSVEYDRATTNQLFIQGAPIFNIPLITGINASNVRNDTVIGALTGYYGITNRLEAEIRVPYVYRTNSENATAATIPGNPTIFQGSIDGHDIGDVEAAVHYQINDGLEDWPIFVGNFRYKSDTGTGPFDVGFSQGTGLPLSLATGSGFHTLEPSVTALYPLDPVVVFGNLEFDYSISRDINKTVLSGITINHVTPGWAVGGTLGMGIAMNQKLSAILGYQHYYVASTNVKETVGPPNVAVGTFNQSVDSQALQVGSFLLGGVYQLAPNLGLNFQTLIGATRDAPDVRVIFRVPYTFSVD